MFIVTINRAAIDAGDDQVVRVQQEDGTLVGEYTEVEFPAGAKLVSTKAKRQDGATVWIEAAVVRPLL